MLSKKKINKSRKTISIAWIILIVMFCSSILGVMVSEDPSNSKISIEIENEPLKGKYISFMGDSITTYQDWSNNVTYNSTLGSNAIFYDTNNFPLVSETYWKKTVDSLGLKLCVNNSWSGSRVTTGDSTSWAGCLNRAKNLHNNNKNIIPDIIVVYMGINDYNNGVTLGTYDGVESIYDSSSKKYIGDTLVFADAYATMIHKITKTYPSADIYICTLEQYNTDISSWNTVIKQIARDFNCTIVDFYNCTPMNASNLDTYFIDRLHPNTSGMNEMYKCLKECIEANYS